VAERALRVVRTYALALWTRPGTPGGVIDMKLDAFDIAAGAKAAAGMEQLT